MKITYDSSVDAAYIYLSYKESISTIPVEGVDGMVNIDISSDGKMVGIEIIPASLFLDKSILDNAQRY